MIPIHITELRDFTSVRIFLQVKILKFDVHSNSLFLQHLKADLKSVNRLTKNNTRDAVISLLPLLILIALIKTQFTGF